MSGSAMFARTVAANTVALISSAFIARTCVRRDGLWRRARRSIGRVGVATPYRPGGTPPIPRVQQLGHELPPCRQKGAGRRPMAPAGALQAFLGPLQARLERRYTF